MRTIVVLRGGIMQRNRSRKREAIIEKIRSTDTHPSAEWIYHELKPEITDLSMGTVYRNLAMFKEDQLIMSVGTVAGQERFDGNIQPHGHFVCNGCHSIIDVELPVKESMLVNQLEESKPFMVEKVDLTFYGNCNSCL